MKKKTKVSVAGFSRTKFVSWVGDSPRRIAALESGNIMKFSTYRNIRSGSYWPSPRMQLAVLALINNEK